MSRRLRVLAGAAAMALLGSLTTLGLAEPSTCTSPARAQLEPEPEAQRESRESCRGAQGEHVCDVRKP